MLVSCSGLAGSGKDTVADYLVEQYGFSRISFAGTLKDAVSCIFGWDRTLLEGTTPESRLWREQIDQWWADRLNIPHLSPRWILQFFGTNVCRTHFHDDIWLACVENKLRRLTGKVIVTDCRFSNEIQTIKKIGGITIRVERGPKPTWYNDAVTINTKPTTLGCEIAKDKLRGLGIHSSEYSSVGLEYDFYLNNNHSIEELYRQVEEVLDQTKQ